MGTRTDGSPDRLPRYDRAYKRLFTQPEMVEELLRGFLREDWVAGLDFSTLEPVNGSFVGRGLEERHGDLIWRLRWRGGRKVAELISPDQEPELWPVVETWMRAVLRRICPEGIITPERVTPEDFPMIYDNFRKWFADARKEGRKEGQLEALQTTLLRILSKRFGPVPSPVSEKVERISSVKRLQTLLDRVLEVDSLKELRIR